MLNRFPGFYASPPSVGRPAPELPHSVQPTIPRGVKLPCVLARASRCFDGPRQPTGISEKQRVESWRRRPRTASLRDPREPPDRGCSGRTPQVAPDVRELTSCTSHNVLHHRSDLISVDRSLCLPSLSPKSEDATVDHERASLSQLASRITDPRVFQTVYLKTADALQRILYAAVRMEAVLKRFAADALLETGSGLGTEARASEEKTGECHSSAPVPARCPDTTLTCRAPPQDPVADRETSKSSKTDGMLPLTSGVADAMAARLFQRFGDVWRM